MKSSAKTIRYGFRLYIVMLLIMGVLGGEGGGQGDGDGEGEVIQVKGKRYR